MNSKYYDLSLYPQQIPKAISPGMDPQSGIENTRGYFEQKIHVSSPRLWQISFWILGSALLGSLFTPFLSQLTVSSGLVAHLATPHETNNRKPQATDQACSWAVLIMEIHRSLGGSWPPRFRAFTSFQATIHCVPLQ